MKLSAQMRYGLQAMIELAKGEKLFLYQIVKNRRMPAKYLSKLLTSLVSAGLVRSKKGKSGGYYLAKPPDQITAWDIYVILDGCPIDSSPSPRQSICADSEVRVELYQIMKKCMQSWSLARFVKVEEKKRKKAGK